MTQKLMRFTQKKTTKIGLRIRNHLLILLLIILYGCPKEEFLHYDYIFLNNTSNTFEIKLGSRENESRNSYILKPNKLNNTSLTTSFNEFEDPKNALNNSINKYSMVDLYRNDTLVLEWRGPAYYGGTENHFYNTNAWTVQDTNPFNSMDGIFIFTIYPEDLEQGTPP